jgi:hypothetical protein
MTSLQNFLDANVLYTEHKNIMEEEWSSVDEGLSYYFSHLITQHTGFLMLSQGDLLKQTSQLFSSVL